MTVPNVAKSVPIRSWMPTGSPPTTTTKYSRHWLSLTWPRPRQIPRSRRHSRSGLSS
ncbi:hypothetical protein LCL61_36635 [Amycolatopsis coloradensis]|uniref:Uncharacterized protein n=1 Tax=Amycolatopsis coloradensis TaxID=76021 RepID=A0ACD5BP07_9PSEU